MVKAVKEDLLPPNALTRKVSAVGKESVFLRMVKIDLYNLDPVVLGEILDRCSELPRAAPFRLPPLL